MYRRINYIYDVPGLGQKFNLKALGWVTDHWTISGITQLRSDIRVGVPASLSREPLPPTPR